jgi:hypothetical protein
MSYWYYTTKYILALFSYYEQDAVCENLETYIVMFYLQRNIIYVRIHIVPLYSKYETNYTL